MSQMVSGNVLGNCCSCPAGFTHDQPWRPCVVRTSRHTPSSTRCTRHGSPVTCTQKMSVPSNPQSALHLGCNGNLIVIELWIPAQNIVHDPHQCITFELPAQQSHNHSTCRLSLTPVVLLPSCGVSPERPRHVSLELSIIVIPLLCTQAQGFPPVHCWQDTGMLVSAWVGLPLNRHALGHTSFRNLEHAANALLREGQSITGRCGSR